jgi:hypothetical protein
MKKFLLAAVVSVAMLAGTMPAKADNSEEVIIGILGGALGGLIIGEALGSRPVYAAPPVYAQPPVVVYEEYVQPAPVQCVYKKKRVYNAEVDEYVVVKKRVCYR